MPLLDWEKLRDGLNNAPTFVSNIPGVGRYIDDFLRESSRKEETPLQAVKRVEKMLEPDTLKMQRTNANVDMFISEVRALSDKTGNIEFKETVRKFAEIDSKSRNMAEEIIKLERDKVLANDTQKRLDIELQMQALRKINREEIIPVRNEYYKQLLDFKNQSKK